jgi:hypothetical protein
LLGFFSGDIDAPPGKPIHFDANEGLPKSGD